MSDWGDNPFEAGGADEDFGDNSNPFTDQAVSSPKSKKGSKKSKNKSSTRNANSGSVETLKSKGKSTKYDDEDIDDDRNVFEEDAKRFAAAVDESDLVRREREVEEREKQAEIMQKKAKELEALHKPNYPPFPEWCCIKPWVVHRIKDDIPDEFRRQQRLYFLYFHYWIFIMWANIIACGIQMKVSDLPGEHNSQGLNDPLVSLVLSIVYAVFIVPIGFYFRYWFLYKSIKNRSSVRMIIHLLFELVNVGWSAMMCSGAWKTGGAGFAGALLLKSANLHFSATWVFINGGAFLLDAGFSFAWFAYIWFFYRNGGLKFSDASTEAAEGVASNKTVQRAAVAGAKKGMESKW